MNEAENMAVKHWQRWIVLIWLLACVVFLVMRWQPILVFGLGDTDDNLRMAQVRALLNGQDWYDLRQYKLNPPEGYTGSARPPARQSRPLPARSRAAPPQRS